MKKIKKLILAAFIIAVSNNVNAAFAPKNMACPSLNLIQQSASSLTKVYQQSDMVYTVVTSEPVISFADLGWSVSATVSASDKTAALTKAKEEVKNTSIRLTEVALFDDVKQVYFCHYVSREALIVASAKK